MVSKDYKIIDDSEDKLLFDLKKTNLRLFFIVCFFIILNTFLLSTFIKGITLSIALNANLLGINIFGFLIGCLVALLPYRKLNFRKKYLLASLKTIVFIQGIITVLIMVIILMTLFGWY